MLDRPKVIGLLVQVVLFHFITTNSIFAQRVENNGVTPLFSSEEPLPLKLSYSIKEVRYKTNDSTYLKTVIHYKESDEWDSVKVKIRARGNFRRINCYHVPIKLKFKKSHSEGTIFEGNKKLKLVLPCKEERNANDYVVKEFLAYKLYEVVSDVHFKTRLVELDFQEEKKQKVKSHSLKGILIEDIDLLAERVGGFELKKNMHPLNQDAERSIKNAFFQYMIGNTDFSARTQHNDKLLFVDECYSYVPYDFDMCGLVNASYATVSGLDNIPAEVASVTERVYKGYARDPVLMEEVRAMFLEKEADFLKKVDAIEMAFESQRQYEKARSYVLDFFAILKSDVAFSRNILEKVRY